MHRRARIITATLAGFAALAAALGAPVYGGVDPSESPATDTLRAYARAAAAPEVRTLAPDDWDALNLGRAVDLWLRGQLRDAVDLLETINVSTTSSFDEADRAAFLLATAYLQMDDRAAFERVAERAGASSGSPYRRWIRYCQLLEPSQSEPGTLPAQFPGAAVLSAALLIERDQPGDALTLLETSRPDGDIAAVHYYLQAIAREAAGGDATPDWNAIAKLPPGTGLEADLVGTALLELAARTLESGGDPTGLLLEMPAASHHTPRALHMRALLAIEKGDTTAGHDLLAGIADAWPGYAAAANVALALGGIDMDRENWQTALDRFESAESDWAATLDAIAALEDPARSDEVWAAWEHNEIQRTEIRLVSEALLATLGALAEASLDLQDRPAAGPGEGMAAALLPAGAAADTTSLPTRFGPDADEWRSLAEIQRVRRDAVSRLGRQNHTVELRQEELIRLSVYTSRGRRHAAVSARELAAATARLDSILSQLDAAVALLEATRDNALLSIATRTRDMAEEIRRDLLFMDALRHFHVEGPNDDRPEEFPEGVPAPAHLLTLEAQLSSETASFLSLFALHYNAVIANSFDQVWQPRISGDSRALFDALLVQLLRANRITTTLDSTLAGYETDVQLAAAVDERDRIAAEVETLRQREEDLRGEIAVAVATRARETLLGEREAIDYHLADAAYELAVGVATDVATAEDAGLVSPPRLQAMARLDTFLTRYPGSIGRGEGRFRLADLRLMQARDDFQAKMSGFLDDTPTADDLSNRQLAPFVDYGPAVSLYEAMLAEDTDYPHMDAVLFNLGMILSDDGQPGADEHLMRLVQEYPGSPSCQEAWLRMGSDRFDRKAYAECVPFFEEAIAGSDPSFTAIALYKLGWARFEENQFDSSADAFRRLMDHYGEHAEVARAMDLRDEAEEYLVHSLARSGGAPGFAAYFDGIGGRDYEARVLLSLGHLMRSVSLYEEAVACDELWLSRYPEQPKALAVAGRLVRTYRAWNKPDLAREAKLAQSARFLPGSDWYEANDDSLRAEAVDFAQSAYRETAAHYHEQAREKDVTESWRLALENYEQYLVYWPGAGDAPTMHYLAGEAASRLTEYPAALDHFATAAQSDTARFAGDASWHLVAVTDTWYRSTQPADGSVGSDSLAALLLLVGERFVERHSTDARGADIVWRQGNVAYAHAWYDTAAVQLAQLGQRYPADPRATAAMRMSGDARYRLSQYDAAAATYERTIEMAQAAGIDTVVTALEPVIPLCYYKHAESIADRKGEDDAAPLFAGVARRWPGFEYAHLALYRAGLGFVERKQYGDAAVAWEELLSTYPQSEYARDSAVQIARAHEKSGNIQSAAGAWERFSRLYSDDPDAPEALLRSVDLLAESGDEAGAEEMRSRFVDRFPGETETVMEIRSERATRELARVTGGTATLSALLAAGSSASAGTAAKASDLEAYLALAEANPELASPRILAQVDYLKAEEAYPAFKAIALTQPLPPSLEKKKKSLEALLTMYRQCAGRGVSEYARASSYRIGEVLIQFGDDLLESERPEGLSEDDLLAYEEVLEEQSWQFYDRGEEVWTEVLQQLGGNTDDPGGWITRTREALWPRMAQRFMHQPEVDYPLVAAIPPAASPPGAPVAPDAASE